MKSLELIPRGALVLIITAQMLLLLPHLLRLPVWIVFIYLFAFLWRVQIYRRRLSVPGRWLKLVLIGGAMFGIVRSYGSVIGLEPTVALLMVAFALKLLESTARKDGYILIFLGFLSVSRLFFSVRICCWLFLSRLWSGFLPLRSSRCIGLLLPCLMRVRSDWRV